MNVVPPVIRGIEVDPTGRYVCPLCRSQRTDERPDTGWVSCPLVHDQIICLGSCFDFQAAARSSEFETHFDRPLFEKLAQETRHGEQSLRAICLRHQLQIIDDRLLSRADDAVELKKLKEEVWRALAKASVA